MSSVLGLNVSPSTATVLPRKPPANIAATLRAIERFLTSLTAATTSTSSQRNVIVLRSLDQSTHIFGEAGTAKTRARMEKFAADPVIQADAAGHLLNIGTDLLAQVGDLVDEGHLSRKEGVGRVFDEFGSAPRSVRIGG